MLNLNDYRTIAMLASRVDIAFDVKRIKEDGYIHVNSSRITIGGEYIMMGEHTIEVPELGHTCSGNPRIPLAAFRALTSREDIVKQELIDVLSDCLSNYRQKRTVIVSDVVVTYEAPRISLYNPKKDKTFRFNLENGKFSHLVKEENAFISVMHISEKPVSAKRIESIKELLVLLNIWEYNPMFNESEM